MRLSLLGLLIVLVAVAAFTASNLGTTTLLFWRWPVLVAPLSYVVVGAAVLGALLVLLVSWPRHRHLGARIRELEGRLRILEAPQREAPSAAYGSRSDDTRRFP